MRANMGIIDRIIRIGVAAIIVGLYLANIITGTVAVGLLILAGVLLLTSVVSFCPLYLPLGISTNKKPKP